MCNDVVHGLSGTFSSHREMSAPARITLLSLTETNRVEMPQERGWSGGVGGQGGRLKKEELNLGGGGVHGI